MAGAVSAACDFKRQVVYPATLDIGVRVEEIGRRSFAISRALSSKHDELVAVASSVNAWVITRKADRSAAGGGQGGS